MTKKILIEIVRRDIACATIFSCLFATSALAQSTGTATQIDPRTTTTGPAKAIGPAPANSPQKQALDNALSSQTRQTLAEAMKSYDPSHTAPPAK